MPSAPTARQIQFVAAYLALPDQTKAAITAGFSEKTARSKGNKLMKVPWVAAEIAKGQAKLAKRFEITTDRVLQELAAIGFANIGDFVNETGRINIKGLGRDKLAAVSELIVDILPGDVVRTRIKLHDKRGALVDLGKHLGLFKPVTPFDDPDPDPENIPVRAATREILLALQIAMRDAVANTAAPAAPPIKH